MTSYNSCYLWGGQGRSPRTGDEEAEEDERNSHEKREAKAIPGRGKLMCRSPGVRRVWQGGTRKRPVC